MAAGVYVTVAVQLDPLPLGVHVAAETDPIVPWLAALALKLRLEESMSLADSVIVLAVSSFVEVLPSKATGASLIALTVKVTVTVFEPRAPSLAL